MYRVYFPNNWQIETVQDLEFDESYNYKKMRTKVEKEPLFSFFRLELLSDSTFNIPIRDKELPTALPILLALHPVEKNSDLLSNHFSDNNFLLRLQKS